MNPGNGIETLYGSPPATDPHAFLLMNPGNGIETIYGFIHAAS